MNGVELIAAERKRQIEVEGWTAEHDDQQADRELSRAGGVYALSCGAMPELKRYLLECVWPWWEHGHPAWWKPSPDAPIRQLVKAGALIAAEIDRLQRKGAK